MTAAGISEENWQELTKGERARKVLGMKLDGWISGLQAEEDRRK
jgi:hypothetical protein